MLAAVRNFVIVFIVAALVFGVIAYFITGFIADNIIGIAESPEDTGNSTGDDATDNTTPHETLPPKDTTNDPGTSYPDLTGNSFNILFIGTDYRPDDFNDYIEDFTKVNYSGSTLGLLTAPVRTKNADLMMLVCVNEESRRVTFTVIPADTRVSVNGEYRLLKTCYDKYGSSAIVDFVNYLTAVPIDYFIRANVTDAATILNLIDGVEINVPSDVYNPYYNPSYNPDKASYSGITGIRDFDTKIMIPAGQATINSDNLFALLHYRTDKTVAGEHEAVMTDFARAAVKKAVSADYLSKAADLFSRAIAYTETNMAASDILANIGIFKAYNEFEVITLTYPGTVSTLGGEECFVPSVSEAYALFRSYNNIATAEN